MSASKLLGDIDNISFFQEMLGISAASLACFVLNAQGSQIFFY